jgi:hypothetical protein
MSQQRTSKKTPGFGKRVVDQAVQMERKPTSMERLKTLGRRWLSSKTLPKKPMSKRKSSLP